MTGPHLLPDADGKVAFVTGAGGDIGRAVVSLFRTAGARVAAADAGGLDDAVKGYLPLKMDAHDERQVIAAIGSAAFRLGKLDYVVHCAGNAGDGALADMKLENWRAVIEANLTSAFLIAKQSFTRLVKPGGSLVLVTAIGGPDSGAAGSAANAGIVGLTRHLAKEWAHDGLRINCVAPGPGNAPTKVAGTVAFLCSEHAASTTGTFTNIAGGLVLD